jgi:transcriptional regulator with XRE-family HTH domain
MSSKMVNKMRLHLGLTSRQFAVLLQVPHSQLTMATCGRRHLPLHTLPSMHALENIANRVITDPQQFAVVNENETNTQRQIFIQKQIRPLLLQSEKLQIQLEKTRLQLDALERLCLWLPQWMASPFCQADEGRLLDTQLLLRQSTAASQKMWQAVQQDSVKLLQVQTAIRFWENLILDFP